MIAVDTSVAIPLVASWHEAHIRTSRVASGTSIPAHALAETYAVLTRLPPPHRLSPDLAASLLVPRFSGAKILVPPKRVHADMLARLSVAGIGGGATYDALVALTAASQDALLLSRDARAAATYRRLGISFELLD